MNSHDSEYSQSQIRVRFPRAEICGSWFRHRWVLDSDNSIEEMPADIFVPPRVLTDVPAPIVVNSCGVHTVSIEVYSQDGIITGDTMSYISVLAVRLKKYLGPETRIDGMTDHPLFNLVRLEE
jgi:hypothetical protein